MRNPAALQLIDPPTASAEQPPADPSPAAWGRPLLERQVELLGRLAEAGVDMALMLRDQAKATQADASAAPPSPHAAHANDRGEAPYPHGFVHLSVFRTYERMSRGARLALMLQEKLITALQQADLGLAERQGQAAVGRLPERKAELTRIAVRIGERQGWPYPRTELALRDRLERDLCGDILNRPYSEVLADVCKDIGLAVDWPQMAREAWAVDEILSGQPGWPLADFDAVENDDETACGDGEPVPAGGSP